MQVVDNIERLTLVDEKRKRGRPSKKAQQRYKNLELIRLSQLEQAKKESMEEAFELNRSITNFMWGFPRVIDSLTSSSNTESAGPSDVKICSCGRIYPPTYLYGNCLCGELFAVNSEDD
ncbi:uncharacterized protein LOC127287823 isoform X2 [Leptopilina boulardi]|uniref:uncharacterized protein LOC127287823 isoform X2 n=1 Tax=Leptopilina boulardi TaxID=63433 RepID=UPI0021F5AA0E|nr:uncharacterized protein LOC127287823 isoform X2 [Leptopilina boulardi]